MDSTYQLWARDREQIVVALEITLPARKAFPAVIVFAEPVRLDHGPHRAVEQQDALVERRHQRPDPILAPHGFPLSPVPCPGARPANRKLRR